MYLPRGGSVAYVADLQETLETPNASVHQQVLVGICKSMVKPAYSDPDAAESDITTAYGKEEHKTNNCGGVVHLRPRPTENYR